ncbi:hypothetical protein DL768_010139 [Monosporascus sp. mg162]|nr:hypothetical protein DL768_010139 [Monosporascus sp. mg162]
MFSVEFFETSGVHTLATPSDTILTLNNPDAPFAVWDEASGITSENLVSNNSPQSTPSSITFHVSSQNLIQASPVWKTALTGNWKESSVTANGCHEINTEGWDTEAMFIVLSIIHSRTSSIPRTVTLEKLSKIAVLVDYYKLHEALHFFASLWIDNLRSSLPTVYDRDLILWICVSWVFKDATIFKIVTKLAIEHSPAEIQALHLPIPESIISRFKEQRNLIITAINTTADQVSVQREAALEKIISSLHSLKLKLINGTYGCSFECRSILLGALIKNMHDDGLPDDGVETPVQGRSLIDVINKTREMKSPSKDWHQPTLGYPSYSSCQFSLSSLTAPSLKEVVGNIKGLELHTLIVPLETKQLEDTWTVPTKRKKSKMSKEPREREESP